ncbi:MAG: tRNA (adenosine(37)-N6)-threonylcarbamoyltransferase complex dimerization subunit type 1 TsaB [Vicinamibacterales bacterium]
MIILALDTTTKDGSIAVLHDATIRVERTGDPSLTHGQRLPGELAMVLAEAGLRIEDVDLLAVAAGPGSFTGLRIGIATIQGIAMAHDKRVVPVSALEALARAAINADRLIGAWMDAQRKEVFAALYAADGRDLLIPPVSAAPRAVLQAWSGSIDLERIAFIGDGATHHRDVLHDQIGAGVSVAPPPPLAGLIGQIAAEDPARAVRPHAIVPIYVRRSDAELARARRAAMP